MARVEVAPRASAQLDDMAVFLSLPADTRVRVRNRLRDLENFPEMGAPLSGSAVGSRYVLGPWPWMLVVYDYYAEADVVSVLSFQDARSSAAATNR